MAPAIRLRSSRVIQHKKGGNQHRIPYAITVEYTRPPVDRVPPKYHVAALAGERLGSTQIQTVDEAIAAYMLAFRSQFSALGAKRREQHLKRFSRHLKARNHSMQIAELTQADGQAFLDALVNPFDGSVLSLGRRQDYRGALTSFSRFLVGSGIIKEDVFFALQWK